VRRGEGPHYIAGNSSENDGLGTCEAHHVGISPQEDRGGAAEKLDTGKGGEEEGSIGPNWSRFPDKHESPTLD
jgi:hypothetical protein